MPKQQTYYEPDAIDCNTLVTALASDFGAMPTIDTRYERDEVLVVVRCYKLGQPGGDAVQVQALVRRPLRAKGTLWAMQYSALLDCWHQLDRGLLAVAKTPVQYSWTGRPTKPARHGQ